MHLVPLYETRDALGGFRLATKGCNGFDIVTGNPPYINVERLNPILKKCLFRDFSTCTGRTDIYIGFIEKSLALLRRGGIMSFIIPYAFTNQNYAELARINIIENFELSEIVDTSDYLVFDHAMVKNIILRVKKDTGWTTTIKRAASSEDFRLHNFGTRIIVSEKFKCLRKCRFETKEFESLLDLKARIERNAFQLRKICFIGYGVRVNNKTDKDKPKAYYVSSTRKEGYKPFVEGKNINRYTHSDSGWLNYVPSEHYNPMFPELFENEKIIFINVVSGQLRFAYDSESFYNSHTVINCVRIDKLLNAKHISARKAITEGDINLARNYPTKFLLGVLNSKIIYWYFSNFMSEGLHIFPEDANQLPIPMCDQQTISEVTIIVDRILTKKKENPLEDTTPEDAQIDRLLLKAYQLSEADGRIIMGHS